uniref:Uncharacterized protein n=1 Tax=mine drainage metagenome TaxID=410659 RepID=E6QJC7_9ZZZZ
MMLQKINEIIRCMDQGRTDQHTAVLFGGHVAIQKPLRVVVIAFCDIRYVTHIHSRLGGVGYLDGIPDQIRHRFGLFYQFHDFHFTTS